MNGRSAGARVVMGLALVLVARIEPGAQAPGLRGFPDDAQAQQRAREQQFRAIPDSARLKEYMTAMAGEPHVAGRPGSRKVAEYTLEKFKSWGLNASIETFEAYMPWPTERLVEQVAPTRFTLALGEPAIPDDPDSGDAIRRRPSTPTPPTATSPARSSTSTTACRPTTCG